MSALRELFEKIEDTLHPQVADKSKRFEIMLQVLLLKLHDERIHRRPTQDMTLQDFADAPVSDAEAQKILEGLLDQAIGFYGKYLPKTVPKKIRAASLMKVPYTLVVGDKEIEAGTVAARDRDGTEVRGIPFDAFAEAVAEEARVRSLIGVDLQGLLHAEGSPA